MWLNGDTNSTDNAFFPEFLITNDSFIIISLISLQIVIVLFLK